jgi:hypothetical protein
VFARLNTQPLEDAATRTLVRDRLALPGWPLFDWPLSGWPQMLLALGVSRTAPATARRPADDLIQP